MATKIICNKENPNGIVVEMTAEEIAEKENFVVVSNLISEKNATAKAQKEADALAGNNKLLELGLTQAQVTAMTGYTPPAEV
jgi:hypothetical protein